MAGNEWINGYLEAILSTEQKGVREGGGVGFNPQKYFVEEVVSGVDECDLHRTWLKVVATRNSRERSSRLENMCWRIWHLARKKKQVLFLLLPITHHILSYHHRQQHYINVHIYLNKHLCTSWHLIEIFNSILA